MKKLCVTFVAVALALTMTWTASAIPPAGPPRPPEDKKQPGPPELVRTVQGETSISGAVRDQNQKPLKDVMVKLSIEGVVVASTQTDGVGAYNMKYIIDIGKDKTIMLWYVAPGTEWVSKTVVLHESKASLASHLISPCIPRVQVKPFLEFNVQMVDVATRNRQIAQSECLSGTQVSE
ncbi:MAG: hypothetical protein NTX17_03895 [Candidatus Eisenbacteria bacterium]|nr:hypothetical protein [Candidatus Eisenbacteria bacterium]